MTTTPSDSGPAWIKCTSNCLNPVESLRPPCTFFTINGLYGSHHHSPVNSEQPLSKITYSTRLVSSFPLSGVITAQRCARASSSWLRQGTSTITFP